MSFFRAPASLPFQSYLFPTLPFRRRQRQSSTDSTASTSSSSSSTAAANYLPHHESYLRCTRCSADLCSTTAIVSRGFTGRWGRAYLVSAEHQQQDISYTGSSNSSARTHVTGTLPNTTTDRPVSRHLVTGPHTVSDIRCALCHSVLGWKYIAAAEEAQKYKVGKYILETKRVGVWTRWEEEAEMVGDDDEDDNTAVEGGLVKGSMARDVDRHEVEFDSQDEDECEDLFMGVWTPELALRRRAGRGHFGSGT